MRQLSVFLFASLFAAPAFADWQLTDGVVSGPSCAAGGECTPVPMPCAGTSFAVLGDQLYVTCDTGGILVIDAASTPPRALEVRRMLEPVAATAVKVVDGKVWVETAVGSRPIESFERTAPPVLRPPSAVDLPAAAEPAEPEEPARPAAPAEPVARAGTVVEMGTGWVIIDIGSTAGVREGGWVEFLRLEEVDLGDGQSVQRERRVGIGEVDTLNEGRAKVELGLNERVPVGAIARANPQGISKRKVLLTPRRPNDGWEIEINTRPFLALSTLGGGAIMDGRVGKRFDFPLAVDLVFEPFAFGVADAGNILTFAGNVVVSYDTTAFQIGLGAGASRINTLPVGGTDYIAGENAEEPSFRVGFSAAQFVRLGSVDGLHLAVLNNFALVEDEFVFGGITVDGQVPVRLFRDLAWIIFRGGGGVPGHIFVETGIRLLARGNGGPGSVFLSPTVGYGSVQGERWDQCTTYDYRDIDLPRDPAPAPAPGICRNEYAYGGPLVGFGVEWRF